MLSERHRDLRYLARQQSCGLLQLLRDGIKEIKGSYSVYDAMVCR
jgi:hypothetical protein